MQEPISVKLVVVGDGAVGKTCLLISYTQNKFPLEYVPTVFDNYTATVKIDNRTVNFGLWDTAGQEEYSRLRPLAYTNSDIFLIVFAVTEPSSFVNARKLWYPELRKAVGEVPIIFVGNKIDVREEKLLMTKGNPKESPILKEVAQQVFEDEFKCKYMECSALTQEGLKNVFDEAIRIVLSKKAKPLMQKKKEQHDEQKGSCNLI